MSSDIDSPSCFICGRQSSILILVCKECLDEKDKKIRFLEREVEGLLDTLDEYEKQDYCKKGDRRVKRKLWRDS